MDPSVLLTAIKWALIVFIAGFIGYFGKFLGKVLIARFHRRKELTTEIELEKERIKLEKKKLKLEKKKKKLKEKD